MSAPTIDTEMINDYRAYLLSVERAAATVEKYIRDICVFSEYLGERELTKESAIEYKQALLKSNYAQRSVNSVISSLNGLFSYISRHDCKLRSIKIQKQIYCAEEKELTRTEYTRLICAAHKKKNERLNLIMQTVCATGIRISELQFITVEAICNGEAIVSLKGKTRKVFIIKELKKKLLCYIRERKIAHGSIFVTRTGKPVSRTNIWREMKALCESARVDSGKVFPHNLRHLFARTFYSIDKDIAKLADILGHESINTTRIYIVSSGIEHRRKLEKMHLLL